MVIGPVEHKTIIRFRKLDNFESYINTIDIDYDSEDVTFTGYVFKQYRPQLNVVKRSAYSKSTNHNKKFVENHAQNCYLPTSGKGFID